MTSSVYSHPWLGGLFGDPETEDLISPERQLAQMQAVEAAYSRALGAVGRVPSELADLAAAAIERAEIDVDTLRSGAAQDGLAVPALARELKSIVPPEAHSAVHAGLTSQDVIDTALVMSLKDVCAVFRGRIEGLADDLRELSDRHGANTIMGRTRMQAALPITVRDRLRIWAEPLDSHISRLDHLSPRLLRLQLGGAVGDNKALGEQAEAIGASMAQSLGLTHAPSSWHAERDGLAEFAGWLSLVSGTLGKMGQDIALMAQQGIDEIALAGGGGSSAMPHKQNPVLAELLVTLARFNATQLSGMHQALVHEQERSGVAWTLEWMILPQMILTTGRSLSAARELCQRIEWIGSASA